MVMITLYCCLKTLVLLKAGLKVRRFRSPQSMGLCGAWTAEQFSVKG